MPVQSYRDLEVYQRAKQMISPIHELVATLLEHEKYYLCDQLRRISMGSANEMIEHLEQTTTLKYAKPDVVQPFIDEDIIVGKHLNKLIQNWH